MWKDPIVEEIHSIREQIARECNYDLKEIIARLKKKGKEHLNRLLYQKGQRISRKVA
jgi:hypothetical protein